jgi:hypothetical protein
MDSGMLQNVILGFGILGVCGLSISLGFLTQNKDNGADIQKSLGIIAAITIVLVGIFGVVAYMYFQANINYMTPFVLIMTFVNLAMSTIAVSIASLQVVNS